MNYSLEADGFRLAYDRTGTGPSVVLLHGWPGDRTDYRKLVPLLVDSAKEPRKNNLSKFICSGGWCNSIRRETFPGPNVPWQVLRRLL
jgi:hypothetical protein